MSRNRYSLGLRAQAQRTRLVEQWQVYPVSVQHSLSALLQEHGVSAARLATEALEHYAKWRQDSPSPRVVESNTVFPAVTHRCLYQRSGGGCFHSTGSAFMKYCAVHTDVLLPP